MSIRSTRPVPSRRRPRALALAAGPLLALALAACSPAADPAASPTSAAGSSATGSASTGSGTDAEISAARDAYDLQLARCIRAQGVDVADPAPGVGITESGPEVQAASETCVGLIGPPPTREFTPAEMQAMQEQQLKVASCLRSLGYDVADPTLGSALAVEGVPEADFSACQPEPTE